MNVDTGKISPQFHVIFDDKFETVVSIMSDISLDEQCKSIFCLGRECYKDVDYDENGIAILPPLTSLFRQDAIVPEITPASPWTLRNDNINFPLALKAPRVIPSGNLPANHPLGDLYQRE